MTGVDKTRGRVLIAILAGSAIPFIVMGCCGYMFYLVDIYSEHYPYQSIINRVLDADSAAMPLWNPYLFCGMPLLADPQMQVLYPVTILYRFLSFPLAFACYIALNQAIASAGMALFLMNRGLSMYAVVLGAMAYGLGAHPFMLTANAWTLASYSWIPWIGYFAHALGKTGDRLYIPALAISMAWIMVVGQPQYVLYGFTLAMAIVIQENKSDWRRGVLHAGAAMLLGIGCAALLVFPEAICILGSERKAALPLDQYRLDSLVFGKLWSYAAPLMFLNISDQSLIQVRALWANFHFVGSLTFACAISALFAFYREPSTKKAMVIVILGLVLAALPRLPVLGDLCRHIPPFSHIRHSALWLCLTDFGLAWLGAEGLQKLKRRQESDKSESGANIWGMMALGYTGMFSISLFPPAWKMKLILLSNSILPIRAAAFAHPAIVIGAGAICLMLYSRKVIRWETMAFIFVAFTYMELLTIGFLGQPSIKADILMKTSKVEEILGSDNAGKKDWYRIYIKPTTLYETLVSGRTIGEAMGKMRESLKGNLSAVSGLRSVLGQNPLMPEMGKKTLRKIVFTNSPWISPAKECLDRLCVRYVVSRDYIPGGHRLMHDGYVKVYKYNHERSPVWVEPSSIGRIIDWESAGPGLWKVEAQLSAPGEVVVSDNFAHGWKAEVDGGMRVRPEPAHETLLSVKFSAGRHAFSLIYDPIEVKLGAFLSAISLGFLIFQGASGTFIRRKQVA